MPDLLHMQAASRALSCLRALQLDCNYSNGLWQQYILQIKKKKKSGLQQWATEERAASSSRAGRQSTAKVKQMQQQVSDKDSKRREENEETKGQPKKKTRLQVQRRTVATADRIHKCSLSSCYMYLYLWILLRLSCGIRGIRAG